MLGVVGILVYVVLEVLVGEYLEKVDIWSVGVFFYVFLVGILLFYGGILEVVFEFIKIVDFDLDSGLWKLVL